MIRLSRRSLLSTAVLGLAACSATTQASNDLAHYVAAYYYAFPIYEFARTGWAFAAPTPERPLGRYNQIFHRRTLSDYTNRNVTTPNNDTIYSSARLDLSNGPVLAEFPTVHDRYFSIAFMNAYTDNFAYIGTRATHGNGGRVLIVGPNWEGQPPADARLIRSATNDVWMVARILVDGADDLTRASAVQDGIRLLEAPESTLLPVAPTSSDDLANLFAVTNAVLARAPLTDPVGRRAATFGDVGLRPGDIGAWTALGNTRRASWTEAAAQALSTLRTGFSLRGDIVSGWRYPPPGVGAPGDADDVRAAVALSGLAALEPIEATYARADEDDRGEALNGADAYQLTIPPDVPANAFWSLSMYELESDGRLFFTQNPIGRYAIGDRTPDLARNDDGSITIALQRDRPASNDTNWLPTPAGQFVVTFRFYLPQPAILTGAWRLSPLTRTVRAG